MLCPEPRFLCSGPAGSLLGDPRGFRGHEEAHEARYEGELMLAKPLSMLDPVQLNQGMCVVILLLLYRFARSQRPAYQAQGAQACRATWRFTHTWRFMGSYK